LTPHADITRSIKPQVSTFSHAEFSEERNKHLQGAAASRFFGFQNSGVNPERAIDGYQDKSSPTLFPAAVTPPSLDIQRRPVIEVRAVKTPAVAFQSSPG
jgi:hypothetical protein